MENGKGGSGWFNRGNDRGYREKRHPQYLTLLCPLLGILLVVRLLIK